MAATNTRAVDPLAIYTGTLRNEDAVNERLRTVHEHFILISAGTSCVLRPGCSVSFNRVIIDPKRESYPMKRDDDSNLYGERQLYGRAIFKLANAAGVAWNGKRSYRVDSGRDPYYCCWHVEGARRALDGEIEPIDDDAQIDLRDGSMGCAKIWEEAKTDNSAYVKLRDKRAKILEHAQTGAKLRALRKAFGLGTFTLDELQRKPFLVTRLVFDGYDDDPEMFRENKRAIRSVMLQGVRAAFGAEAAEKLEAKPVVRTVEPPPVGTVPADDEGPELEDEPLPDDWGGSGPPAARAGGDTSRPPSVAPPPAAPTPSRSRENPPENRVSAPRYPAKAAPSPPPRDEPRRRYTAPGAAAAPPPQAQARAAPAPPPPPDRGAPRARTGFTIPGGQSRGRPIEDASDDDLAFWSNKIGHNLRHRESMYPAQDEKLHEAMLAEIDRRLGEPPF